MHVLITSCHIVAAPTLSVSLIGDETICQIYPMGIRQIKAGGRVDEWQIPKNKHIIMASANSKQACAALSCDMRMHMHQQALSAHVFRSHNSRCAW